MEKLITILQELVAEGKISVNDSRRIKNVVYEIIANRLQHK